MFEEESYPMFEEEIDIVVRMSRLTKRMLNGEITATEQDELNEWLSENDKHRQYLSNLFVEDHLEEYADAIHRYRLEPAATEVEAAKPGSKLVNLAPIFKWAAVVFLFGFTFYLSEHYRSRATEQTKPQSVSEEILPGAKRATLTLGDGSSVSLQDGSDTSLARSNVSIHLQSGSISYEVSDNRLPGEINTVATPKGGEWSLQLSDGTKVWLNAASSISYPTAFSGNSRLVKVSGEAYFEVAGDEAHPFIVSAGHTSVKVLGTSFNVEAYPDDSVARTTLATGAVQVVTGEKLVKLLPGHQAISSSNRIVVEPANVKAVTAWKDGYFLFDEEPLQAVMKELENWYDVKVVFAKGFNEMPHFSGKIYRDVPITKLLEMISHTGIANFQIEGKTVTVKKKN